MYLITAKYFIQHSLYTFLFTQHLFSHKCNLLSFKQNNFHVNKLYLAQNEDESIINDQNWKYDASCFDWCENLYIHLLQFELQWILFSSPVCCLVNPISVILHFCSFWIHEKISFQTIKLWLLQLPLCC